jgi:flavodoxin
MDTLIAYYSRGGNSRKAAEALADHLSGKLVEIPCDRYDGLPRGLINAGHDSVHKEAPEIGPILPPPSRFSRVVVGGPVWVWGAAPPVRTFLRDHDLAGKTVGLFVTYGGGPHGRPLDQMEAELGRPADARSAFSHRDLSDRGRLDAAVERLARAMPVAA